MNTRVEVGVVKAHKLPTDTYTLRIDLIDSVANYGVSSSKRFFVYNPSVVVPDTLTLTVSPVLSTTFGAMSDEELDDLFEKSKYIATNPEIDKYKALSTQEAKREFIYNFWKARDENASGDRNETYLSYTKRVSESDQRFTAMGKQGWKSDRGRVYIIYGNLQKLKDIRTRQTPASIALVRSLGFDREGLSRRYLKIRGRWRDHERWAMVAGPAARRSRT